MTYIKTIAWDVDDVLNDLMQMWFEQKRVKANSECRLRYEELIENPPHRLLGFHLNDYLNSLDEFRLLPLYQQISPVKEIMEWFVKYGDNFRHIALTAVPLVAAPASAQWVFKHFGRWIRTFHFVPSKRDEEKIPEYDIDKGAFLKWMQQINVIVDDSPANIRAAESIGIKGILWPRPWNESKLTIQETLILLEDI